MARLMVENNVFKIDEGLIKIEIHGAVKAIAILSDYDLNITDDDPHLIFVALSIYEPERKEQYKKLAQMFPNLEYISNDN